MTDGVSDREAKVTDSFHVERITHGRHCVCSACAAQDWTEPQLAPCGMHGPSCPPRYAPLGAARDPIPGDGEAREVTFSHDEIMGRYLTDAEFHAEVEATRKLLASHGRRMDRETLAVILHTRESAAAALRDRDHA